MRATYCVKIYGDRFGVFRNDHALPIVSFAREHEAQTFADGARDGAIWETEMSARPTVFFEQILHQHLYVRVLSMQRMIGGIASHGIRCGCGWESHGHPNEGQAGSAWIGHIGTLCHVESGLRAAQQERGSV